MMKHRLLILLSALAVFGLSAAPAGAGGWDKEKGLSKTKIVGELICVGCSLKRMDGANAQCGLYAQHALGVKTSDGTFWNIIDNATGHEVIRGHGFLDGKQITIDGYIYPVANMIEIDSFEVEGVTKEQIAKHAWELDQVVAKALSSRKIGEPPVIPHVGKKHDHDGHDH